MDPEFRYPQWQRLPEAAILEFDPLQLWVRRLQELTLQKGSQDEHQALTKGILTMRILEKNRGVLRQSLS